MTMMSGKGPAKSQSVIVALAAPQDPTKFVVQPNELTGAIVLDPGERGDRATLTARRKTEQSVRNADRSGNEGRFVRRRRQVQPPIPPPYRCLASSEHLSP
jgi:hypothetical protein